MARKVDEFKVEAEGRDKGKTFVLTEMSATAAERWATRAFLALAKSGIEIPDDIAAQGLAGIAGLGLKFLSHVNFYEAEPLLDEMMGCVQIKEAKVTRPPTEYDIEEIATILELRKRVFALHVDFSTLASRFKSAAPQD